jgi:hypothetical protein
MSVKKGKDTRTHRSPRQLPELKRILDSTPDKALPMLLLLNRTFISGELQVECVVESSAIGGLILGQREVSTDSARSVWSKWPTG